MLFRGLLMAMAVCGLVFSGCAKKPKQIQQAQATAMPEPAAAPKVDTGEVFNEYYKDSKGNKVGKTFSMNAKNAAGSYTPEFSENGNYVVQIASGPSSSGAEEMANAFKGKGYPAYVAEVQNPTPELSGTYYRVRIGGFSMLADAKAFGENILRPANYDYWVDLKSNDAVGTGSGAGAAAGYSSGASSYTPTPSYTPAPAASEPVYTPSAPAATPDYSTTSSSTTTTTSSSGTSSYDWGTPAATTPTPAASEPAATTPSTGSSWTSTTETPAASTTETTPSTGSSWTTEPSTTPATTTPATETQTTPAQTTPATTDTGWGGSWK
jgi:hypothetical protein